MRIELKKHVLHANNELAAELRDTYKSHGVYCINMISSPGSGKTSLLEKTIPLLGGYNMAVVEGDVLTERDAERVRKTGVPAVQIETSGACHLDAPMIQNAIAELQMPDNGFLFIENVGNLVCPTSYDLGEAAKVVVISVTEGDDKPGKYPAIFMNAKVCVLNKTDLLPYTPFDVESFYADVKAVNKDIEIIEVSCQTGEGLDKWADWLKNRRNEFLAD